MAAMKLGMVFYRHQLTPENFRYARQIGCTHAVVHLVDYFNQGVGHSDADNQPVGDAHGWGVTRNQDRYWELDDLLALQRSLSDEGLVLEALENFDPAWWYDVLLDGPGREAQMEGLKTVIRRIGQAGIPVMGYNFSLAGVAGRVKGNFARGGAESVGMKGNVEDPVPRGMVWNMRYDLNAPEGFLDPVTHEQLWDRARRFLEEMTPVAEEAGVRLAAHPDDPPLEWVRGMPRLVWRPDLYQKLLDLVPSPSNALEFCLGTIAEMADGDVYEAVERYSAQKAMAYVHFRNIRGKAPFYEEDFIDEGDVDMFRVLEILHRNDFDGVLIPDHTPLVTCDAPWHAGMAYAVGYMKAAITAVERGC